MSLTRNRLTCKTGGNTLHCRTWWGSSAQQKLLRIQKTLFWGMEISALSLGDDSMKPIFQKGAPIRLDQGGATSRSQTLWLSPDVCFSRTRSSGWVSRLVRWSTSQEVIQGARWRRFIRGPLPDEKQNRETCLRDSAEQNSKKNTTTHTPLEKTWSWDHKEQLRETESLRWTQRWGWRLQTACCGCYNHLQSRVQRYLYKELPGQFIIRNNYPSTGVQLSELLHSRNMGYYRASERKNGGACCCSTKLK